MFVRPMTPQISTQMSRPAAEKPLPPKQTYPLRRLAHFFAVTGLATVFYASALVAIAVKSSIIEF